MTPRLIGYWRLELPETNPRLSGALAPEWTRIREEQHARTLQWPDAAMLVDPAWPKDERRRVAEYLQRGTWVNQMRGLSRCRFCERPNGSAELTDGVYCWPEGLAHYVSEHDVRLPEEFVGHVLSQPPVSRGLRQASFDELGQRDRSWPGSRLAYRLWGWKRQAVSEPYVKADPGWWRQFAGMRGEGNDA